MKEKKDTLVGKNSIKCTPVDWNEYRVKKEENNQNRKNKQGRKNKRDGVMPKSTGGSAILDLTEDSAN